MWGFHWLKRGILLEGREDVRKSLQLQQVQWTAKTSEPHTLIHRGSNYTSMTRTNEDGISISTKCTIINKMCNISNHYSHACTLLVLTDSSNLSNPTLNSAHVHLHQPKGRHKCIPECTHFSRCNVSFSSPAHLMAFAPTLSPLELWRWTKRQNEHKIDKELQQTLMQSHYRTNPVILAMRQYV